jgi:hypothetical protein
MEDWRSPRGRNLDFEKCLSKFGTDKFKEAVETRLNELQPELPLDTLCEAGGDADWEESPEYDLGDPVEHGNQIIFHGDVWFDESIATGCRDHNFPEERHGQIFVEINKESGRADVTFERAERRNLEYY